MVLSRCFSTYIRSAILPLRCTLQCQGDPTCCEYAFIRSIELHI